MRNPHNTQIVYYILLIFYIIYAN